MGISGVVGLDLSLTSTGIARFDINGAEAVKVVVTDQKDYPNLGNRFRFIVQSILQGSFASDLFFIEDYAWAKGVGSKLVSLAELNGVVKYVLWRRNGCWPTPINIQTIKKWVKANKKDEMRLAVYKKYDKEFKTTDEVDAYVLADFAWAITFSKPHGRERFTKWEKDILDARLKKKNKIDK